MGLEQVSMFFVSMGRVVRGGHTHKVGSVLLTVTAADCKACQSFLCLCETTGESNPLSDNSQSPRRRETFRCQVLGQVNYDLVMVG